jgi:hypothetical protein
MLTADWLRLDSGRLRFGQLANTALALDDNSRAMLTFWLQESAKRLFPRHCRQFWPRTFRQVPH